MRSRSFILSMMAVLFSATLFVACGENDTTNPDDPDDEGNVIRAEFNDAERSFKDLSVTGVYDTVMDKVSIVGSIQAEGGISGAKYVMLISFHRDLKSLAVPYTMTASDSLMMTYRVDRFSDTATYVCNDPAFCNFTIEAIQERTISGFFSGNFRQVGELPGDTNVVVVENGEFAVNLD